MILSFHYDGHFTIATDLQGRTYRVLLASGKGKPGYCLEPWRKDGKIAKYRRSYVWQGEPLYASIEAAERARPRPKLPPLSTRFEADFA